mmetsp:Transcript_7867/g.12183  ORF Transcript_7867/g.12183 Transcript_7867/m.12183 type:complete len:161 (-) Transcript_7867:345-827(-)
MENQTDTEYDTIKLVREVQIMRRLNRIQNKYDTEKTAMGGLFTPEMIDIICPETHSPTMNLRITPDTFSSGGSNSGNSSQNKGVKDFKFQQSAMPDVSLLSQVCVVLEFMESDLDQILKHNIDFNEQHLLKIIYSALCSLSFVHETNIMHRDLKSANILI